MTTHTFTDAELAAHNAAIRSAALAEAVKWLLEEAADPLQSEVWSIALVEYAAAIRALSPTPPDMVCVEKAELDLIGQLSQTSPTRTLGEASDNLAKVQDIFRAMLAAHGGKE